MHYGLLPRAHRGIFALNELPDLAGRIQVGLFNILQEGDVQIKGYPIRLPLDVCMVFTANPEDYTARGKIITPLKDRIGSEIRTHYPAHPRAGRGHHAAGGLDRARRPRCACRASSARWWRASPSPRGATRRSTSAAASASACPSARWRTPSPTPSGARCRTGETPVVPRISDIYAALPAAHRQVRAGVRGRADGRRERRPRADPRGGGRGLLRLPGLGGPAAGGGVLRGRRQPASCATTARPTSWLAELARVPGLLRPPAAAGRCAGRPGPAARGRGGVRARGPLRAEEDRPQRRPRLRRRRAARRRPTSTWSGSSACAG